MTGQPSAVSSLDDAVQIYDEIANSEIYILREEVRIGITELRQVLEDVNRKQNSVLQRLGGVSLNSREFVEPEVFKFTTASAIEDEGDESHMDRQRHIDSDKDVNTTKSSIASVDPEYFPAASTENTNGFWDAQGNGSNLEGHSSEEQADITDEKKRSTRKSIAKSADHQLFGSMNHDNNTLDQEVYDVSMYYYDTGVCQKIARSDLFNNVTFAIIGINTIYIGVDADRNPANVSAENDPTLPFIVCDFMFCLYFSFEWFIRFFSFRRKRDCLKDMWFRFDTALVALMVWETWAMPLLIQLNVFGKVGGAGPVGMIKMLRLLRLARMARLMRAFPELIAMIKGVRVAAKAVGSALLMLLLLIYTFSIIMFVQLRGNNIPKLITKFETLGNAMWTMLCDGVFLDSFGTVSFALLGADKYPEVAILVLFVLASNLTVMNMLIGVLCEVVSAVAAAEKEDSAIKLMKETLLVMLRNLDEDHSGLISKKEISKVLEDVEAQTVLVSLAVDVNSLVDQLDMIFSKTGEISIQDVMNFILMMRGERQVTVRDMTHGQGVTRWRLGLLRKEVTLLHQKMDSFTGEIMGVLGQLVSHQPMLPSSIALFGNRLAI